MSHQPERKEKVCLNCGETLIDRFCHHCGQENIVTHQGFWALSKHFIYDIFHFDGKFFESLKHIFIRPGRISLDYISGKRVRYFDPVRMYLFTSALFFLTFYALQGTSFKVNELFLDKGKRLEIASAIQKDLNRKPTDSILRKKITLLLDTSYRINLDSNFKSASPDSIILFKGVNYKINSVKNDYRGFTSWRNHKNWFARKLNSKLELFNQEYSDNPAELLSKFAENFLHKLPYLLFISLPIFASILNLLYLRKKKYFYSDHAIFTLHHYILSFILMVMAFLSIYFKGLTQWAIWSWLQSIFLISWIVYLYVEMKKFYAQGTLKTIAKMLILSFLMVLVLLILFTLFFFLSLFQL